MIPLILRLKKAAHKEIAKAQDIVVETMYEVFDDAVIHGGTAIWRCYRGNRFSEDIDVYLNKKDPEKISAFFQLLQKKGFLIEKKKTGENSIFSTLRKERTIVRFEAVFEKKKGVIREYETCEGNIIAVYTLTPENLVSEKVSAYLKRLKIRDLYDIFFLLRYIENISPVRKDLEKLLAGYKKAVDESDLKVIILEGSVPNEKEMVEYIRQKF